MIIVGAKGFAKEILQIVSIDLAYNNEDIVFFDNVSRDLPDRLFNQFKILKSFDEVKTYLANSKDKSFVLGLGNPKLREALYNEFVGMGAFAKTVYSNNSEVGDFDVLIEDGVSIMSGAILTNSIKIGKGCLININATIAHDCILGDFIEISPNANISGRCEIGSYSSIGTNAILIPDVKIGKNVTVGAGTVVLKNVPDNTTIVVPGKII